MIRDSRIDGLEMLILICKISVDWNWCNIGKENNGI